MKKHNLKGSLLAALVLTSGVVCADDQYPATDFQPTIVYQNEEYISKNSANTASTSSASTSSAQSAAGDDKYPAANFQPEVLYSDPNYKHGSGSIGASAAQGAVATASAGTSPASTDKASDSTASYWIGLIVMALGGAAFFKSSSCAKCTKTADAPVQSSNASTSGGGLTGVARYLNRTSGTGVSRYLERVVKTGAAHAATGVERYIRNRR